MIELSDVSARAGKVTVRDLSCAFGPGITVVLGNAGGGVELLLSLISGAARPSRGVVTARGREAATPAARRVCAYVPLAPDWPEALRVDRAITLAATLRGAPCDPVAALGALGIEGLAGSLVGSLPPAQLRAVALAEAFASAAVRVIVIEDVFGVLDPVAQAALPALLRAAAPRCIVVSTPSVAAALSIGSSFVALTAGRLTASGPIGALRVPASVEHVRMVVVAADPPALAEALAAEDGLTGVEIRGRAVVVTAPDARAAADAVGRAALRCDAVILELSHATNLAALAAPAPSSVPSVSEPDARSRP